MAGCGSEKYNKTAPFKTTGLLYHNYKIVHMDTWYKMRLYSTDDIPYDKAYLFGISFASRKAHSHTLTEYESAPFL